MKRVIMVLLVLSLAVLLGCGGGDSTPSADSASGGDDSAPVAPPADSDDSGSDAATTSPDETEADSADDSSDEAAVAPSVPSAPVDDGSVIKSASATDSTIAEGGEFFSNIACGGDSVSFTLSNPGESTLNLAIAGSYDEASSVIKVSFNSIHFRNLDELCGQETLEPAASASCQKVFADATEIKHFKLRVGTPEEGLNKGNRLSARTLGLNEEIFFNC